MLFLNPLVLSFLAAAAIPVIIHLLNKRRHKTIQWAAMSFLLKAKRESRGKKKLRHILILACRAMAIAALAFAAARPVTSGLLGWGGGSIDTIVLILDRSSSMEIRAADGQGSRREQVLAKVRETMKSLNAARLVLIDSASGRPQEIASPDVLADISSTAATDSAADFPALLSRAAEVLATIPGRSEIWLASDLQLTNWHPDDERWAAARASLAALPQQPTLRVLSLSGPAAQNTAIRLLSSRRVENEVLLDLELFRPAEARGSANLPLTTQINGIRTTETFTLPGQSLRFQKRIPVPSDREEGSGWLSLPADGNPRDNTAFFAYGPARPVKSLIVAPAGETARYLSLSASPPSYEDQTSERIDPSQLGALDDIATIFWAAPLPTGAIGEKLQHYLSNGGQIVFLPPGQESTDAFLGMKWSAPSESAPGKFLLLKEWNHADGPLRDGLDGTPLPAAQFKAIRRQVPLGDSFPLARWEDGEPFLARTVIDQGTAWFLGTVPDYTWSNLGDAHVLLPFSQRIITTGAERFDAIYQSQVGSETAAPKPGETLARIDDSGTKDPANTAYEAGIFRLGTHLLAINRPPAEDDPEVLTREQLDTLLDGTHHTLLDQADQSDAALTREMWRAFLIAVLLFLISEAILCLPKSQRETRTPQRKTA